MLYNIPSHKRCKNCGDCCGVVVCNVQEKKIISDYVKKYNIIPISHKDILTCKYRDNDKKMCLIYPVRPTICKLMGVTKGMTCKYGNTADIDGHKFINANTHHDVL